jgi:hypothetical protein
LRKQQLNRIDIRGMANNPRIGSKQPK